MKTNTTHKPTKLVALMAGAALFGMVAQSALAAPIGTASGTVISNLATLDYKVGTLAQTPIGSSAAGNTAGAGTATPFTVDNKINLSVVDAGAVTTVTPGQNGAVHTFTVTNLGNTVQDFALVAANLLTGTVVAGNADTFDGTGLVAFIDTNSNGVLDVGEKTFIDELPSGSSVVVTVLSNIPLGLTTIDFSNISLLATARAGGAAGAAVGAALVNAGANTAGVDVVFADTVPGTDDIALNGDSSARGTYDVVTATLTVQKTVTPICDPADGNVNPKNIPGSAVRYAITVSNSGTVAASLTSLGDTLDAALLMDPKLNSGAMPATNCVSGNVANSLSASGFAATFGTGVAPGTFVAADATTAGASIAGQIITITYGSLTTANHLVPSATLAVGDYVTVFFNAFVQ
ncbi:MAG: hypothetical protein HOO95_06605 [Gallionella sp.]|nr:hypothetical protein [Gallionella sp.]